MELGERQMIKKNEDLERMEKKLKKLALAIENPSSKKEYWRKYKKLERNLYLARKRKPSIIINSFRKIVSNLRLEIEELLEDIERLKRTELSVNRKKGGT